MDRRLPSEAALRWLRRGPLAAALILLVLTAACSQRARRGQPRPAGVPERPALRHSAFFLDPLAGFPREVDASRRDEVAQTFRLLVEARDTAAARVRADRLLASDPGFEPALVLLAQIDLEEAATAAVTARVEPIVERHPGYLAAELLLARSAEVSRDAVTAYAGYLALSGQLEIAARQAGELLAEARDRLAEAARAALSGGDLPAAEADLARLVAWSPGATPVLEVAREVAVAKSDRGAELAAISRLSERFPDRRDYLERRGDLELEIGRAAASVEAFQALVARYPEDPSLAEKLDRAKFRWRLDLLPAAVRAEAQATEISRGGFAALLYWVMPEVRYAKPTLARIATDILDHPQREAIARVANLGLMQVDPTLHRFAPEVPTTRGQALSAILSVLSRYSSHPPRCLLAESVSAGTACELAQRCRLLAAETCLAGERLSGAEAVELLRRAMNWP